MDKIIQKLKCCNKKFPYNEVQEAINNKEDISPILLDILDKIIENPSIVLDDPGNMLHEYSMYLLAQFREKQAFTKIIKLVSMHEDDVEDMFGDLITESLSSILYSTYDGNLELIQGLIEDSKIHFFVRTALLDLYVNLYNDNVITKNDVIKYLKKLVYELPFDEDNDLASDVAIAVSDAHLFELIEDIEYLYAEDRVDETIIGEFDCFIDMIYNYDFDYGNVHYIDDAIKEMDWWACFEQSNEKKKEEKYNLKKLYKEIDLLKKIQSDTDKKIKIGRNDNCPCGSGKKYKKCCMNKAEQDITIFDDKEKWLRDYPVEPKVKEVGRVYLSDNFDNESIEIDKLVYLALHHRPIPIYVKRDEIKEDQIKINYLIQASKLFIYKCEKENITSFDEYDNKYKIHYYSQLWHEELSCLIRVQQDKELYKNNHYDVEKLLREFKNY